MTCTLERARFESASVEEMVVEDERKLGPIVLAKEALEPEGRWQQVRAALVELVESENAAEDGSLLLEPEYLLSVVELPD